MSDMLTLTGDLPEMAIAPGDILVTEGTQTGAIWVLVDGSLQVTKRAMPVAVIDHAGAVIGEVAVLRGAPHASTVTAITPCRLRIATDGAGLLRSSAEVTTLVAEGLARRLDQATTYLADLERQYGDAPGIAMVSEVLGRLSEHPPSAARPGSAREPDPEY